MVVEVVEQQMVLASTALEKYLIPDSSLPNLQSRGSGIIMSPLVQSDEQDNEQMEHLVFPITHMTRREQQVYNVMPTLRTLCKALRISPNE